MQTDVAGAKIRSLSLHGPAGRLEALLNTGAADARYCAVVCHPHPLYGGTMHNKVVFHAMKALHAFGIPVLRFNFRGVGRSQGTHDHGRGEVDDVRAALEWLEAEYRLPILFAGFSFGAATGLRACCPFDRVAALIALGLPIRVERRVYDYAFLKTCTLPKLFVSGGRDPFSPSAELEQVVTSVPEPKHIAFVPDADHFFDGKLDTMRAEIENWLRNTLQL